jgi:hypothetical protein
MIPKSVSTLFKDLQGYVLPRNVDCFDKIKGELKIGKRFYWYYKEDLEFFTDEGEKIKDHLFDIASGIIVPIPDTMNNHGELDVESCFVVIDNYPAEKEYPEVEWISLFRLLDDEELVEFFEEEDDGVS